MTTISTDFTVPCAQDRAVLAVQDTIDRLGWKVLDVSSSRVVVSCPITSAQIWFLPKLTVDLSEVGASTRLSASISMSDPMRINRRNLTGILGQFVNSVSLRVQTESLAINPTVAIGEGQGGNSALPVGRVGQLLQLKELLDAGLLTDAEFDQEKARILRQP